MFIINVKKIKQQFIKMLFQQQYNKHPRLIFVTSFIKKIYINFFKYFIYPPNLTLILNL